MHEVLPHVQLGPLCQALLVLLYHLVDSALQLLQTFSQSREPTVPAIGS